MGAILPHARLGSPLKNPVHNQFIGETIIGDCLEACQTYANLKRDRTLNGITYLDYHPQRRFDLLKKMA